MQVQEIYWNSKDQLKFYSKVWKPEGKIIAWLGIIHGMGEHSGRYQGMAEFLFQEGIAVFAFDHRGHGKTQGQKGHTPSYQHLLNDVDEAFITLKKLSGDLPVFLLGHSMGGNVLANYLIERKLEISGSVFSSPYFRLAFDPPAWKVSAGKLIVNILPSLALSSGLITKHISRIPAEVERYEKDALVHDKISARFFDEITKNGLKALEKADEIRVPVLAYHGSGDRITSHEATREFASKIGKHAQYHEVAGGYHELHHDKGAEDLLQGLVNWMKQHIS